MTPTQAIAIRALWRTLGENGNLLAKSWARLLGDIEPTELIKLAERLSAQLPKLYADTTELITATGHILEAEGDRLEDLGAVPPRRHQPDLDPILDELLTVEDIRLERENGKSELRARQAWHEATGLPYPDDLDDFEELDSPQHESPQSSTAPAVPTSSPHEDSPPAGAGEDEPENRPGEAPGGPQEGPNPVSGPAGPESPVTPAWEAIGALLTEVTPDTIPGMELARMIHNLERLERAMQAVHLWPEGTLQALAERWLGEGKAVNWRDAMGHDIKAFTIRALMHATKEVERTGLGARALHRHRQNEETTDAGQSD